MGKNILFSIGIMLFLSAGITARADTALSENDIRHFMNAMKPLQELGKKYDFVDNNHLPMATLDMNSFSPMSHSLEKVKNHKAFDEFSSIIQGAGFSSVEQWANIGDRIIRAYLSLRIVAEMTPEKIQEIQKSLAEVKQNNYLSPEVKKQLLNSLKRSITLEKNMSNGDKADQKSLKAHLVELEQYFEETE